MNPVQAVRRSTVIVEAELRRVGRAGLSTSRIAVNRLLVETDDEKLPPVPDLGRVPLDLLDHVARGLGGKIHDVSKGLRWGTFSATASFSFRPEGLL